MSNVKKILIDIPQHEHNAYIGKNYFKFLPAKIKKETKNKDVLIICDSFFLEKQISLLKKILEKENFNTIIYPTDAGKVNKTFSEVLKVYGILETNNFARDSTIIALGGGTVGDMAGFIASTWYRGINLIHIPTTLMAMVDSSIGGKVAVNFRDTINAVGNFYHPIFNHIDLNFLKTLSNRDYISGIAEVLKCSLIADKSFFNYLKKNSKNVKKDNYEVNERIIKKSVQIKLDHVKKDIYEGGKRLLLNYGHTFAHPIEIATQDEKGEKVRHGEAVAIGIVASLYASKEIFNLSQKKIEEILECMKSLKLPMCVSSNKMGYRRDDLIEKCISLTYKDKKRKSNKLRFILLKDIGKASISSDVNKLILKIAYEKVILD